RDCLLPLCDEASVRQPHKKVQQTRRRGEHLHSFEICRHGMGCDFLIELVTQNNHVLALIWQIILRRISGIPDPSLPQEVEARPLNYTRPRISTLCAEEDCCPEDSFERRNKPSV